MKEENKKNRKGFTLIELLLVVAIIGILGTIVVVNFGDVGGDTRKAATLSSIQNIEQAAEVFRVKTGRLPKSLDDLTKGINDDEPLLKSGVKDAWGLDFEYKVEGKRIRIRSAGADGNLNTDDDLTN